MLKRLLLVALLAALIAAWAWHPGEPITMRVIHIFFLYIILPILIGIVTNALWEWTRENISYQTSQWIPIKGNWSIETEIHHSDGRIVKLRETLTVEQQFLSRFSGVIRSPHPDNNRETIELNVHGEFFDKFHAVFWYQPRSNTVTDIGAGLIQIQPNHDIADGGSTNFGVSSTRGPVNATFIMRRNKP